MLEIIEFSSKLVRRSGLPVLLILALATPSLAVTHATDSVASPNTMEGNPASAASSQTTPTAERAIESPAAGEIPPPNEGPAADRVLRARTRHVLADPAASLRAAHGAIDDGDRSHATWLLAEVIRRHPIIADHAAVLLVRVLSEDGQHKRAADAAREALRGELAVSARAEINVLLADALIAEGDREGAFAAWRAALGVSRDEELRAAVLLKIAAMEELAGLDREAGTTYQLLWYSLPTTQEAKVAEHRIEVLEEFLGDPLRDSTTWRRRGDRFFRKRRSDEALEAYDRALALGLSPSNRRRTERQRAHTLFRLRRYPEAVQAFRNLPQQDDIPIWRARSMARAGRVPEAIEEFERIGRKSRGSMALRGRFLAALLLDGRDKTERAEELYRQVATSPSGGGMGDAAGWRLGWIDYREGRYESAVGHFDRLVRRKQEDRIDQLRPRYWRARALARLNDPRAITEFEAIALEYPLSYYGWRARNFVTGIPTAPAPVTLSEGKNVLSASALARPRILLEAGMLEAAREEIRLLIRKARGLSERLELAQLCTDAGDFHLAQRLMVDPYAETLARGPAPTLEDVWWYAWPSAYSEMVSEATNKPGSVEPALVYSIMREESGYRASIVSPVGARGLLQIMTTTGERLARSTGLAAFQADDLFEPRTNIDLGSFYLGELSERFDGRLSASIASYNAGPEAVATWQVANNTADDEWVEAIPYDQTRSYVKRVLRSLHAYRVLY